MHNCFSLLLILPRTSFTCPGPKGHWGMNMGYSLGWRAHWGLESSSGSARLTWGCRERRRGRPGLRLSGHATISSIAH